MSSQSKFKSLYQSRLNYFLFFYEKMGYRVFVAIALSILVGILDGFGLTMFLPLLELVSPSGTGSDLGNLDFVPKMIEGVGLSLNLKSVLFLMSVFFILKGIARFINDSYYVRLQQYFVKNLRIGLVEDFSQISFRSYVESDIGQIQNTFTGEVLRLVNAYRGYFASLQYLVLVFVYMSFAFFVDGQFAIMVGIGGALTNFLYKSIYNKTKKASYAVTSLSHRFEGLLIQLVSNFKYLKATGFLNQYDQKLKRTVGEVEHQNKVIGMLNAIVQSAREPILIIVVCSIILIQSEVMNEPLGPILVSLLFFYRALSFLMIMQSNWNKFLANSGTLKNMSEFQQQLKSSKDVRGAGKFSRFSNKLEVKGVSWLYGDTAVVDNLTLEINRNQTVAFVGESGSGKTTLINILAGLLPPQKGEFIIDGKNANALNLSSFQSRIGYITQEPVVFNDTIFNNITFWDEPSEENKQKVAEVLEKASLTDFVAEQPDKLDTILGNSGVNISGGQKQRISIARELYKDIDILIMDEATSALDSETEKSIQENLESLRGQYTMIVVAHRLSTIKNFDRIFVLKKGKVDASGDFEGLKKESELFKRMVELQGV